MRSIWSIGTTKTILISSRSSSIWRGKKIRSSALLYYGSENEVESFAKAAITQASRSE